ncbi:MAG TPA: TIM barrel protein [Blastocatellia bacterium]|nr:TIM barrel protein [Blastocatellia bacterium]
MKSTRREFVQTSLAGMLALNAPAQPKKNPALGGGGFKLGIVTYNIAKDWDIATIIKNCEATGYEAVELRTTHKHGVEPSLSKAERAEVKQRFANSKVRLLSLGSVCEFHSPDQAVVRQNIDECKRFVELAHDIGALGVKVRPNGIPKEVPEEKTLTQIGKSLRECGEFAQKSGIEIWVEVHGAESQAPWRMRKMMEIADHPQVGICWNSNPPDVENGSVKKSFELLKPWLHNAHINELWKTEYPWRELFSLMKQAQYNRYCLIEIADNPDPLRLMRYYRALWLELCR